MMIAHRSLTCCWFNLLLPVAAWLFTAPVHGQTLTWDATPGTPGVQNGSGTWNTTTNNWIDTGTGTNGLWDNSGTSIAQFGGGTVASANSIALGSATFNLAGINFLGFDTTPASGNQYTLNSGTFNFGTNGVIQAADLSSGGSQFITFGSAIAFNSNGLTFQKSGGTALQFINITMTANAGLTGTLTVGSGIYLGVTTVGTLGNANSIVVQSGGTITLSGSGVTYSQPFTAAGFSTGATPYGAIRINTDNLTLTGGITLTGNMGIQTNYSTASGNAFTGTLINGVIKDNGNNYEFHRFSLGRSDGTLTLAAANTYGGKTVLGRATSGYLGGITILDFSAGTSPDNDILYNGLGAAAGLDMIGGVGSSTVLQLKGAAGEVNAQRLGDITFTGTRSVIQLTSGTNGKVNVTAGDLVRTGNTLVTIAGPSAGSLSTTRADGFLGPQISYLSTNSTQGSSSWAQVLGGKVTGGFAGDTIYTTGTQISALPATVASHLGISSASTGNVLQAAGTTYAATVSMADYTNDRTITVGNGNTLRLGVNGGVQLVSGARSLTVGTSGTAGSLSAGGTTSAATGLLVLSNHSTTGTLTINSTIVNNVGSGAVTLEIQNIVGARTVLTAANTHSGGTTIASGSLEIQNVGALGSGTATVLDGGSLVLASGLPAFNKAVNIAGDGANLDGAIRSLGTNSITAALTQTAAARITSDAGTLTIKGAAPDTLILAGSFAATFSGSGNTVIGSRIGATAATGASSALIKEGTGTLTMQGSNNYTGGTTVNGGTLQLDFSPTTTGTPVTNVLYNGIATPGALTLGGGTLQLTGKAGATNSQAFAILTLNNYSNISFNQNGATSLSVNLTTITRNFGGIVGIDLPTTGNLTTTGGTANTILSTGSKTYAFIRDAVNGDEWAATDGTATNRNIVKLSAIAGGYTASTSIALAGNANIAAGVTNTNFTTAGITALTSLRFGQVQATTITQSVTGRIITTGGILVSSTVGANTSTISVSTLRPAIATANTDLPIIQNNPAAPLVINSAIANAVDTVGTTSFTSSLLKAGTGVLELRGVNTFSGNLRVYEGTVQFAAGSHNSSVEYLIGSGATSGKVMLGSGSTAFNTSVDYINVVGSGTANSIVGGASVVSEMTLAGSSADSTFSAGFLGGSGTNENNLSVTMSNTNGRAVFGPANTYGGQTSIRNGTVETVVLADGGAASSLGTGALNSIIDLGGSTVTAPVGTLRYTGSAVSTTNRVINLTNSSTSTSVTGVIENNGTGTVKFTSAFTSSGTNVTGVRTLRLGGINTTGNEIVGIGNNGVNATVLEKSGDGTWMVTGDSTHSGGTNVVNGTLLAGNATGSATGTGNVSVSAGATLGGTGRIAPGVNGTVTLTGATLTVGNTTLNAPVASILTVATSGTGSLSLLSGSVLALDLIGGAGTGDHTGQSGMTDLAILGGNVILGVDSILRVSNPNLLTGFAVGDAWRILDWNSLLVSGTFGTVDLPALNAGVTWDQSRLYSEGVVSIAAIPEPGRVFLVVMGLCAVLVRRRR